MAYAVPAADAAAIEFKSAYTVPAGDAVALAFADPVPPMPAPVRYTGAAASLRWAQAPARGRSLRVVSSVAPSRARASRARWGEAAAVCASRRLRWSVVPAVRHAAGAAWGHTGRLPSAPVGLPWRVIPRARASLGAAWGMPPVVTISSSIPWRTPPRGAAAAGLPWGMPPRAAQAVTTPWSAAPVKVRYWDLPWRYAQPVRWVVHGPGVQPPEEPPAWAYRPPAGDVVAISFACPAVEFPGDAVPVPIGPAACYWAWPQPRTYVVINSAGVVRLPERTAIAVSSISLSSRVDDVCWSVGMQLTDPSQLALLLPDEDGPKSVEITINGYVWTAIIESYDRQRQHPSRRVSVTGRSRTALLDAPYAPERSKLQGAARLAQQLADEELDGTGYAADWGILSWLVPGGVWSYDKLSPLAAVRNIAAAAGAVVVSHPWDLQLQVRPRYPVSPWEWLSSAPDVYIQDDLILRDSLRPASKPVYDYVLVSGQQHGVSDPIIRTGAAGEVRAGMVVDALITQHDVALERGRNVLADRGEQALIAVDIPLFPAAESDRPGLVLPLDLVEVVEPSSWRALAVACSVELRVNDEGLVSVIQTIELERHFTDAN